MIRATNEYALIRQNNLSQINTLANVLVYSEHAVLIRCDESRHELRDFEAVKNNEIKKNCKEIQLLGRDLKHRLCLSISFCTGYSTYFPNIVYM